MAADSFYKVFEKVKYKLVFGLTGTLDRLDGKEVLIKDKCPIIDKITMEEAIEYGWLSPYKEYKVLVDVDLEDYNLLNNSFLKHFAFFNYDFNLAMSCVSGERSKTGFKESFLVRYEYAKSLCQLNVNNPGYKAKVSEINKEVAVNAFGWNRALKARKEFVMNHPKKIELAKKILNARTESKAITFSATIAAAEKIGIGHVLHSGKTKKKRKLTKEEFDALDKGVLNTSKALDCGADIPGLNLGIILCNTSSSIQKKQRLNA